MRPKLQMPRKLTNIVKRKYKPRAKVRRGSYKRRS